MVVSLGILLEALAVIFCLHYLYDEEVKIDFATSIFLIVDILLMQSVHWFQIDQKLALLIYPIIMLYSGMKFGFNIKEIFVNSVLYIIIIGILQATMMMIFNLLLGGLKTEHQIIINLAIFLFVVLILRKIKRKLRKISIVLQSNEKMIIVSLTIMIISILLFILNYKQNVGFDVLYYIVFFISVIAVAVSVIDIGRHKLKTREIEAELRLHKLYEKSFVNLIEDIRARQHEFDNHINAIYSQHLLYKNYEELVAAQKEYCKVVLEENRYNKLLSKGNSIVLAFLYGKFLEAEKKGIEIDYKINIGELECNIPDHKIIELLGNLINNAVEEIKQHSFAAVLRVTMIEKTDEILFEIENRIGNVDYDEVQKMFNKGYSRKGNGRGYGLYNVKKICDDYNVKIACQIKEKQFIITLKISKSL